MSRSQLQAWQPFLGYKDIGWRISGQDVTLAVACTKVTLRFHIFSKHCLKYPPVQYIKSFPPFVTYAKKPECNNYANYLPIQCCFF